MRAMRLLPRGRVLRATFGCNPNSSSLGVDVTFLLFGATFASALALTLGALLRGRGPGPDAADGASSGPAQAAQAAGERAP
jgi:hypothetical protein